MHAVPYPEILARLLNNWRHGRIVDVTDTREEVVFDLKIEPAEHPACDPTLASKIHGRLNLMDRKRVLHLKCSLVRNRELRFLDAMRAGRPPSTRSPELRG